MNNPTLRTGSNVTTEHTDECGYCRGVSELRAAEETPPETPEQQFERHFRNMQSTQLEAEQPTLDADAEAGLTALAEHRREVLADLAQFEPPDAYQLDKLRSGR